MNQYKGECLCGACRYVIIGDEPDALFLCHCSRCRKETGTLHGANVFFNRAQLSWEKGEKNISHFKLENTRKQRAFCKSCGSPLPRQEENQVVLPAGSLDDDAFLQPTAHIFYASRSSLVDRIKGLKRFDEFPS
jgi:hypothetical protein